MADTVPADLELSTNSNSNSKNIDSDSNDISSSKKRKDNIGTDSASISGTTLISNYSKRIKQEGLADTVQADLELSTNNARERLVNYVKNPNNY